MSFTIPQKTLVELVSIAAKVSNYGTTVPVLECIKLRFGGEGISVETTDMDSWITLATKDFSPKGCDTAIVPCKQFHSIVSSIEKDENITLSVTEKRLTVKTKNSRYQFGLRPNDEWPECKWNEKVKPIIIKSGEFFDVMSFIIPSCAKDDTRHYLEGVHISSPAKKKMRFAGCDGHQLSHAIIDLPGDIQIPENGVILPANLCQLYVELLLKADVDTDVSLEVSASKSRFEFSDEYRVSLSGRLVDGNFPDIDKVIPYHLEPKHSVLPREQSINAMRRIIPMATDKGRPLRIEFFGDSVKFTAKSQNSDGEETVQITGDKFKCVITLALSKILAIMSSYDGDTVAMMIDTENPGGSAVIFADTADKITPSSKRFSIIMPMKG